MRLLLRSTVLNWVVCGVLAGLGCGGDDPPDRKPPGVSGAGAGAGEGGGGEAGTEDMAGSGGGAGEAGSAGEGPGNGFDAGTDPNRNAVMPGGICDRLAELQCAAEAACCDNPGRDFNECKQTMKDGCADEYMGDEIAEQPAAAFDPERARIVFTELETRFSTCDTTAVVYGESPEGLRSLFRGTVEPNGSCLPARPWIKIEAAAALAACKQNDAYACLPKPDMNPWVCRPHSDAGGDCYSDANCKVGLYCDNPNLEPQGSTCKPRKADGQSCERFPECASLFCRDEVCVPATQQNAYCIKQ